MPAMKTWHRILVGALLLATLAVAWNWNISASVPPDSLQGVIARVLDFTLFKISTLAVTPIFLLKAVVFVFLLSLSSHLTRKVMQERILRRTAFDEGLKYALSASAGYMVFFVGAMVGVQSLGINLSSLAFLGGAIGLGVGIGLQSIVNNFVSGLILLADRSIKVGDRIEIENLNGDVVQIGARSTWVRTNDNVVIIVPNSEFTTQRVTNWTANDRCVRLMVEVGASYSSDPERVRALLLQVADGHPDILKDPAPDVIFKALGDSSLDFQLRVWTINQVRTPQILQSDLYFAIFKVFNEQGIEIPFPQRDLHIRSFSQAVPLVPDVVPLSHPAEPRG